MVPPKDMEGAVYGQPHQLLDFVDAFFSGLPAGLRGPQVKVTEQRLPGAMQGESKDIGRAVVSKVVPIESAYGCVVEEGHGDLPLLYAFSPQRVAHRALQHRGGGARKASQVDRDVHHAPVPGLASVVAGGLAAGTGRR